MLLASGDRQHKENVWVLQLLISKVVWVLRSFVLVHRARHPCLTLRHSASLGEGGCGQERVRGTGPPVIACDLRDGYECGGEPVRHHL